MKSNISKERAKFLKNMRKKRMLVISTQILILIGFLATWEILARAKIIDSFITSQPTRILKTLLNLTSNDLLKHIKVTVYETIVGFRFRNIFRSINCNCSMVVKIFSKSI